MRRKKSKNLKKDRKKLGIKIISGKFRGKILNIDLISNTRPTKAILRESLFNTLQNFIFDKVFLEIFAGYGSVGFEAFSKGAKKVIFIEKNIKTFNILKNNIKLFEESKSSKNTNLKEKLCAYNKDSLTFLPDLMKFENIDILYFDPPFGNLQDKLDNYLDDSASSGEYYHEIFNILKIINTDGKMIIFEHMSKFEMPQNLSKLNLQKTRKFGKSALSYYF